MRLKTLLQTGLALASLTLVAPQLSVSGSLFSPAAAAVEVEIGTDQFYEELAPYGDWVSYRAGMSSCRAMSMSAGAPMRGSVGLYRRLWLDVDFRRAVRLGDLSLWALGLWRRPWLVLGPWPRLGAGLGKLARGPDYVVWAPLPPTFGDDYYDGEDDQDYEVADNDIPDNYWNAVPAVSFLAANLAAFIYADDDEDYGYHRRRYIDDTEYLGPVRYRNR